jgi:hypothetical protein
VGESNRLSKCDSGLIMGDLNVANGWDKFHSLSLGSVWLGKGFVQAVLLQKRKNRRRGCGGFACRDSGAWYRADYAIKSVGLGLERYQRLACAPLGRVGSNPTPGATNNFQPVADRMDKKFG